MVLKGRYRDFIDVFCWCYIDCNEVLQQFFRAVTVRGVTGVNKGVTEVLQGRHSCYRGV